MKPRLPTEQETRVIVGLVLWTVSGLLTVSLFLTIAGSDLFRIIISVAWAIGLEGAKILTWRRGGWWRLLAGLLVSVTVFSAFGMALTSVERVRADSSSVQLQTVRESARYLSTKADEEEARALKATLMTKLAENPNTYSTESGKLREAIKEQTGIIGAKSTELISLESVSGTSSRTMFDVIGGDGAGLLEIIVSLVLAMLTEVSALVLSGKANPKPRGLASNDRTRTDPVKPVHAVQVIQQGAPGPATTKPVPVHDFDEAMLSAYLKAAREGRTDNRLWGRSVVAKKLKLSERQVRKIYDKLVSDGRILPGAIPMGAEQ